MASVNDIIIKKGNQVWTVGKEVKVLQAAKLMNEHKIGALVVIEDDDRVVGMFTERDVLRRVVGEQRLPSTTSVEEVMTSKVVCCTLQTTLEEARTVMKNMRIRHLPVMDEGRLRGLLSIGDLNAFEAASQEQTIFWLQEYMHGRV